MSNDLKATVTGFVTGVLGLLAHFNIVIPPDFVPVIVLVGVAILGYFTNKTDVPTPPAG